MFMDRLINPLCHMAAGSDSEEAKFGAQCAVKFLLELSTADGVPNNFRRQFETYQAVLKDMDDFLELCPEVEFKPVAHLEPREEINDELVQEGDDEVHGSGVESGS